MSEIIVFGLVISFSNQILYPYGYGVVDTGVHIGFSNIISNTGSIENIPSVYQYFPMHHIFVASFSNLTETSVEYCYYYLGSIIIPLSILFLYITGNKFYDKKVTYLSALFFISSEYINIYASAPTHLTWAISLFMLAFMLLINYIAIKNLRYFLLLTIVFISLIFTHHYTALLFLIVMVSIFFGQIVIKRKSGLGYLTVLFSCILFSYWLYQAKFVFSKFTIILVDYFYDLINFGSNISERGIELYSYEGVSLASIVISSLGTSILIFFVVSGLLWLLYLLIQKKDIHLRLNLIIVSILFIILAFIGIFINVEYILPHRLFALAVSIAFAYIVTKEIFKIVAESKHKTHHWTKIILGCLIVGIFIFSSTASLIHGSSYLSEKKAYMKTFITDQEIFSEEFLNKNLLNVNKNITLYESNSYYGFIHPAGYDSRLIIQPLSLPLSENDTRIEMYNVSVNSFILFNKYDIWNGFKSGIKYKKLDSKTQSNELRKCNKVYDNYVINIYLC